MNKNYFNWVMTTIIIAILIVLSFMLIKPLLLSIVVGTILAFIFAPMYDWVYGKIKLKNTSATIICIILILIIVLPLWFFTPIMIDQSIKIYMVSQQIDYVTPLEKIFPSVFSSETFSREIGSIIHSFVTQTTNSFSNSLANLILNFPTIFLQSLVALFTFFFVLKDKTQLMNYIKSLLPFDKGVEKQLFDSSRDITFSVIYGQVIVGLIQGILVGIGFFIFSVPNALFLTLLAALAGIFPIIGTTIVWLPVVIYLLMGGNAFAAVGLLFFGILSTLADNFLRPIIVSKRSRMHSSVILVGMIGGLFLFGILGFILGPLILAYLFIILEIYRNKQVPGVFIRNLTHQ